MSILQLMMSQAISHGPDVYLPAPAAGVAIFAFATQSTIRSGTGGNAPPYACRAGDESSP
jgi:hypothetical protein